MHESKYLLETSLSYRKEYGQFFTPPKIARLMAEWILRNNPQTILDPAFGLGVFYDEIMKIDPNPRINFTGYEIDRRILNYLNSNTNNSNLNIINDDYLEANTGLYDAIICNPPYMRFQKFLNRHNVLPQIEKKIGTKLVGYANIASVFLVKALKEIRPDGTLSFIMPFEFFNTGYGKEVKRSLIEEHLLKQIIVFSNEKDIFPDATTTVCILLCKKDGKENAIKITSIDTEHEISQIKDINDYHQHEIFPIDLPHDKKWTPIISSLFGGKDIPSIFCRISFYGSFMRGIATGANSFFALSKNKIEELMLGSCNICQCITKSPQIKKAVFTEDDFDILYDNNSPVYCLDIKEHDKPEVVNYVQQGEKSGFHKRYLTKNREPWYKIELRQPAPILFGVFSRGRLKVVRNYSSAINFTCFHSFYPNMFGGRYLDKLFVYFLSEHGQEIIKMNKRSYGNSLDKLEPGDLNDCLCPNQEQLDTIEDWEVKQIIEIAKTNEHRAIKLSNKLIDRIIKSTSSVNQTSCYIS
ncbi:MAG: SAM-dependent DNA methyltransferase [Sedimentisphaerales bacterium]|nr:SAM-dependent DNA methyltransferase [Sedimentisphaerales bacterium]